MTRRIPLNGWPVTLTAEEVAAIHTALDQHQAALDAVVRERDEARAEVERLLTTIAQIERMAARPLCSKEAIHSVAFGALNAWRNPKLVPDPMCERTPEQRARKALEDAP